MTFVNRLNVLKVLVATAMKTNNIVDGLAVATFLEEEGDVQTAAIVRKRCDLWAKQQVRFRDNPKRLERAAYRFGLCVFEVDEYVKLELCGDAIRKVYG